MVLSSRTSSPSLELSPPDQVAGLERGSHILPFLSILGSIFPSVFNACSFQLINIQLFLHTYTAFMHLRATVRYLVHACHSFFRGGGGSGGLGVGEFPLVKIFPLKWRPKIVKTKLLFPQIILTKSRLSPRAKEIANNKFYTFQKLVFRTSLQPQSTNGQQISHFAFVSH